MRAIWSPDSRQLVVSIVPEGRQFANLFLIPVDAPEKMEQLTREPLYNQFPTSWSRPAKAILFIEGEHPGTQYDTMLLPLDTRRPKLLVRTPGVERTPSFSPDGRWFTYTTDFDEGVWVQDVAQTRPPRKIADRDARNPLWSPFGDRIYYLEGNNAVMGIKVDNKANTGAPHRVLTTNVPLFPDATSRGYSVARDRRILILHDVPNQSMAGSEIEVVVNWFTDLERLLPVV
jgi:Tol biopolymer transport system component